MHNIPWFSPLCPPFSFSHKKVFSSISCQRFNRIFASHGKRRHEWRWCCSKTCCCCCFETLVSKMLLMVLLPLCNCCWVKAVTVVTTVVVAYGLVVSPQLLLLLVDKGLLKVVAYEKYNAKDYSIKSIGDLEWGLVKVASWLFPSQFKPLLMWATMFGSSWSLLNWYRLKHKTKPPLPS